MKRFVEKSSFVIVILLIGALVVETSAQVCTPPPSGVVAWWAGDGNANDISGNGHHASIGSAGFTAGHVAQAFNFTAQNQSVVIPNNPALFPPNALTIEGWINASSGCSGAYRIFHSVQTTIRGYATFLNCANTLIGQIFDSSGAANTVVSNGLTPNGTFSHFAMTWDGSNLRLYINGVLDNTAATTISAIGTHNEPLRIGSDISLGFIGRIDEITLYNRALSASEIQAIFNAGTAGKCKVPTAASVSVSGRVLSPQGRSITRARVYFTDVNGNTRTALTNAFGYFRFEDVQAGETYILGVRHKRWQFASMVITVNDEISDLIITAEPSENLKPDV